jgi:hypothetical protein
VPAVTGKSVLTLAALLVKDFNLIAGSMGQPPGSGRVSSRSTSMVEVRGFAGAVDLELELGPS